MFREDLKRDLWFVMGLPLDAITMASAVEHVYKAIDENNKLFISTPNLNFIIASQLDDFFRQSVINSDLSLADGMPLVWVANLLGIPVRERVSGSGLVSALMESEARLDKPVKTFFFGGPEGVAAKACEQLKGSSCGLEAVGSIYPGFGSIEEMSKAHIIDEINQSGAEFIIVALGARKGQEWIELNRHKLNAPVISHLGAVVNFVAGTNIRAPRIFQKIGVEWLWRIKEEPSLWRRYFFDGVKFIKILVTKVLPYSLLIYRQRVRKPRSGTLSIETQQKGKQVTVMLKGIVCSNNLDKLRSELESVPLDAVVKLDIEKLEYFDPAFIGLLSIMYKHFGEKFKVINPSIMDRKILAYNSADFLLALDS